MKLPKSKSEIRDELQQQMESFLRKGGEIADVPNGESGRELGKPLPPAPFDGQTQERTPVSDVLATLDARKKNKSKPLTKRNKTPKKKLITDDFGEPLRWVWEEE